MTAVTALDLRAAELVGALKRSGAIARELTARQIAVLAMACLPPVKLRTVLAIASHARMPQASASRAAAALCRMGLTRRVQDRHDRRKTMIEATERGRALVDALLPAPPAVPAPAPPAADPYAKAGLLESAA